MLDTNKFKNILYSDYGIILNESEVAYIKYLSKTSNKSDYGILKEFFIKCTTRHLCVENNKKELDRIRVKLLSEEIGHNLRNNDSSIMGGDAYIVDIAKYLDKEDIAEIEEETNTLNGNEGLNIKNGSESINKEFETKEEADRYKKEISQKFLVQGQQHAVKRIEHF